jgi:tripartite-type tricarboxylate transporter receptor subunit TctC
MPPMRIARRLLPFLATTAIAQPALAQERRPIRLIIPVGVAGVTDVVGRILAEALQAQLGRPVVPENVPGAGSTVGAQAFHRAPNDGTAYFIGTNNHPVMQAIYPNFPLNPLRDFTPLALVGNQPFALAVSPQVPVQDVAGLLAWLAQQGDAANYGSTNPGATNHMAGELLKQLIRGNFTIVQYRTAANAVQDLVAGRVHFTIDSPTLLAPLARDGRVKLLASSGPSPSALLPGLPSLASSVPGYALTAWQVLFSRPGAPAEADALVRDATLAALAQEPVRQRLLNASVEVWPDPSPAAAARHVEAEVARWAPIAARISAG